MRHGTASYKSNPSFTATIPSTTLLSKRCFMIVVTTPPYSPFSLIPSLLEYA